jgi:hypothetical protein
LEAFKVPEAEIPECAATFAQKKMERVQEKNRLFDRETALDEEI